VWAVQTAPAYAARSLLCRENTGKFANFIPLYRSIKVNNRRILRLITHIPYSTKQGIRDEEQVTQAWMVQRLSQDAKFFSLKNDVVS